MAGDTFAERSYTYERRGSAVRLEPPLGLGFPTSKSIATGTDGPVYPLRRIPGSKAMSSAPVSFAPAASVFSPVELVRRAPKKDAKVTSTRGGTETGGGAGSTRDVRGSRNNVRARSRPSKSAIPRKGRARGSSPIKEPVEMDKLFQTQPRPESLNYKVADVAVTNGEPTRISPTPPDRLPAPAVESNDPPSPSPAYSPFPSRPASPSVETSYITPPVSEEVDNAGESRQEVAAPEEAATPAQNPDVEPLIQGHGSGVDKSCPQHVLVEQTGTDISMDDVQPAVLEVLVEGSINKIAQEGI